MSDRLVTDYLENGLQSVISEGILLIGHPYRKRQTDRLKTVCLFPLLSQT
jgi:hypothetical protein